MRKKDYRNDYRNKNKKNLLFFKRVSVGIVASVIILAVIFIRSGSVLSNEFLLYETIPYYAQDGEVSEIFKITSDSKQAQAYADSTRGMANDPILPFVSYNSEDFLSGDVINVFVEDQTSLAQNAINQANEGITQIEKDFGIIDYDIIGTDEIVYQSDEKNTESTIFEPETIVPFDEGWMSDLAFLRKNFYSVDPSTEMTEEDFNGSEFINMDMSITPNGDDPKILIFHTHMYEGFVGSDPDNIYDGVFGLGDKLAQIMLEKYGIATLHYPGRFDLVRGNVNIRGAYERMEPEIRKVLEDNPSIELVIDIHRDGVNESVKLETVINGEVTAPIMFVNGISKIRENGVLRPINSLFNPYLKQNLAMSFQMQLAANELYPGFARRIYINAYRYSLHMVPKSLLIEIGAQTNTKEEAFRAIEPLADILAKVVLN